MVKISGAVTVDRDRCKGCELCVVACPTDTLLLQPKEVNDRGYHYAFMAHPEKCIGCTKCAVNCATGAITGKLMRAHSIDLDKCTRCRTCIDGCPTEAIEEV